MIFEHSMLPFINKIQKSLIFHVGAPLATDFMTIEKLVVFAAHKGWLLVLNVTLLSCERIFMTVLEDTSW